MGTPQERIYLDHNATTPMAPVVVAAMRDVLEAQFGNPSSTHAEGAEARRRIEIARKQVAKALGLGAGTVYFTAGATESNNMVFQGLLGLHDRPGHVVVTAIEHPSVLEPAGFLEKKGWRVTRLPVDAAGRVSVADLEVALAQPTQLLSMILANNETGVVQDMDELLECARARGVAVHVDATQAVGKWPVDFAALGVDYLSMSAHKLNGPKGSGSLLVRDGSPIEPLLRGGPQEKRLRGGTENVAGIVGLGVACERAHVGLGERMTHYAGLRDRLWQALSKGVPEARWNGQPGQTLPNTLNVELPGVEGEVLLQALDVEGIAASAGAACHSGSISPSYVLTAMGLSPEQARASLRFSVGLGVDAAQIDRAAEMILSLRSRMQGGTDR